MAPAIAHFLIGAAIVLLIATPIAIRYDLDREYAIWLIPLGGIWGLAPDFHNIVPVFETQLYALHNTPWMDLFGLHYTLDRQAVRAQYNVSVFGSIILFLGAIAAVWSTEWLHDRLVGNRVQVRYPDNVLIGSVLAAGYATVGMWVTVSIQTGFRDAAGLVGERSVLIGGIVVLVIGICLTVPFGLWFNRLSNHFSITDPSIAAVAGCGAGVVIWVIGATTVLPAWLWIVTDSSFGLVLQGEHFAALVVYGVVFGGIYHIIMETLDFLQEQTLM